MRFTNILDIVSRVRKASLDAGYFGAGVAGAGAGAGAAVGSAAGSLMSQEDKDIFLAGCLLKDTDFLHALKTIKISEIPLPYIGKLRPIRDAISIRGDGLYHINFDPELIGQLVKIEDDVLIFKSANDDEPESIKIDIIEDQYGLKHYIGEINQVDYQIRENGDIFAKKNNYDHIIRLLKSFCQQKHSSAIDTAVVKAEKQVVEGTLTLLDFAKKFLDSNYDHKEWIDNIFVITDENNKTIFHYFAEIINDADINMTQIFLEELVSIDNFINVKLLKDTLDIKSRNGSTYLEVISSKEKRIALRNVLLGQEGLKTILDPLNVHSSMGHFTADRSLNKIKTRFQEKIHEEFREASFAEEQLLFEGKIDQLLAEFITRLQSLENEEILSEMIQEMHSPAVLSEGDMAYHKSFILFQKKLVNDFTQFMLDKKDYGKDGSDSFTLKWRVRSDKTGLNMREVIALFYFAVLDQEKAKKGCEKEILRLSHMIRGIYDFLRNADGLDHYDPTKSIEDQRPSRNRCMTGSINVVVSFLNLFHEDAVFIQMSDRDVVKRLNDIIGQVLEDGHEEMLKNPDYLVHLTDWHENQDLPKVLKDKILEIWLSREHEVIRNICNFFLEEVGVDEDYLNKMLNQALLKMTIPEKLASAIIDKELLESVADHGVLITKDFSFWCNLIRKNMVPSFVSLPSEDGDFIKSIYWADYFIEKFEKNDGFKDFIKAEVAKLVNYGALSFSSKENAKKYMGILYKEYFDYAEIHYPNQCTGSIQRMISFQDDMFNEILIRNTTLIKNKVIQNALKYRNLSLIEMIIKNGFEINSISVEESIDYCPDVETLKWLFQKGAKKDIFNLIIRRSTDIQVDDFYYEIVHRVAKLASEHNIPRNFFKLNPYKKALSKSFFLAIKAKVDIRKIKALISASIKIENYELLNPSKGEFRELKDIIAENGNRDLFIALLQSNKLTNSLSVIDYILDFAVENSDAEIIETYIKYCDFKGKDFVTITAIIQAMKKCNFELANQMIKSLQTRSLNKIFSIIMDNDELESIDKSKLVYGLIKLGVALPEGASRRILSKLIKNELTKEYLALIDSYHISILVKHAGASSFKPDDETFATTATVVNNYALGDSVLAHPDSVSVEEVSLDALPELAAGEADTAQTPPPKEDKRLDEVGR